MADDDFDLDFSFEDLQDPALKPEAIVVPDTVEDLVEGWEAQDNARTAQAKMEALLKEEAESTAALKAASEEQAAIERQITELLKAKQNILHRATEARLRKAQVSKSLSSTEDELAAIKKNYEIEQERKDRVVSQATEFQDFAWYKGAPQPNGELFKAFDYQRFGAQYIADHKKLILADEMGTGKTCTVWTAMDYLKAKRVLIITPVDITSNFLAEGKMWAPHRLVTNLKGLSKTERRSHIDLAKNYLPSFVIIVNYEAWRRDKSLIEDLIECQFDAVFMDEAHTMKNSATNAFEGAAEIVHARNTCANCGGLVDYRSINSSCTKCGEHLYYTAQSSLNAVVPMTGTPILNSPADMYTLLNLVDPNRFHTKSQFLREYAEADPYTGKYIFAPGGADALLNRLEGKFLRRTMEDVGIHLPPVQIIDHDLDLGYDQYPDQTKVVNMLRERAQIVLSAIDESTGKPKHMRNFDTLALMTRERQANVFPAGITIYEDVLQPNGETIKELVLRVGDEVNESIKLDKAIEIIKEQVTDGKRVAVFSQFTTALAELEMLLKLEGISAVQFNGNTSASLKDDIKRNFDAKNAEEAKWDVVLAHYKSGGQGLNFTTCTHLIMLDQEWNPGKEDQTIARIRRMGQVNKTFVHILQIAKGVDPWMRGLIDDKKAMIGGFNETQSDLQAQYLAHLKEGK